MTEKDIKVIIACHKSCEVPTDPMYVPVQVGSAGKDSITGFSRDDSGENISEKNPLYCELTGLYWAWKNLDSEYLGLVHYRRYFTRATKAQQKADGALASVLSLSEAKELFDKYQVLVPKKRKYYIESIYSHYAHTFDGGQLDIAKKIIEEMCPEYLDSFDRVMKARSAYMFNMYIMPKKLSDAYCEWLFGVLAELEKRVDTSAMTDFEKRYVGRISERLFNVWLDKQIAKNTILRQEIIEVPYYYSGEVAWKKKIFSFLMAKMFNKKYTKSF